MALNSRFLVDEKICGGCKLCELICSFVHHGSFSYSRSKIKVDRHDASGVDTPHVCRHCLPPPCLESCPEGAIADLGAERVQIDKNKCTGCLLCVEACPYHIIKTDSDGKADKCDLCRGKPECTEICPMGVLKFGANV